MSGWNRPTLTLIACGLMPMAIIHLAYWLNIEHGAGLDPAFICNPYVDGCVSTSRAVRSGPGLLWFKAVMLPVAVLLVLSWRSLGAWMGCIVAAPERNQPKIRRWAVRLGIGGAIALVFYVLFLGTEGPVYGWMRRYGVVFFFGFTALAQLLMARFVLHVYPAGAPRAAAMFLGVVCLEWAVGVFSVVKRFIFDNPDFIDRLENITEWIMIAAMSLGFVLLGLLIRGAQSTPQALKGNG